MYEAIILAGGLGTRLRSVVSEVPKVMAPVAGKPFLHYIIKKLIDEDVSRIILAVGYKHEIIKDFISQSNYKAEFIFSIEHEPLGTGGGIKLALELVTDPHVFIINGDSFFDCGLDSLMMQHLQYDADISLALKPMKHFERYGTVELEENRIIQFNEKKFCRQGLINAGVYVIKNNIFQGLDLPKIFSMEKEIFEERTTTLKIMGFTFTDYFIDIGVLEDFEKAQLDFRL
jgi:D-glycero-alpha-D-manno-heptose 1-phosphate guanylyltransferase